MKPIRLPCVLVLLLGAAWAAQDAAAPAVSPKKQPALASTLRPANMLSLPATRYRNQAEFRPSLRLSV